MPDRHTEYRTKKSALCRNADRQNAPGARQRSPGNGQLAAVEPDGCQAPRRPCIERKEDILESQHPAAQPLGMPVVIPGAGVDQRKQAIRDHDESQTNDQPAMGRQRERSHGEQ